MSRRNGRRDIADEGFEVIAALTTPVDSLDALSSKVLPTIAARIWEACCWPERMADGWKIGDFRFVIFSVSPDPKTELYVQFWSEPREAVLKEVCSGEWAPSAVKYVQEPQRRLLRSLGFKKAGEARNFGKTITIANVRDAETAARETVQILFEVFGYRGQWPLTIRLERDERAELAPVVSSITPEDLAKLLAEHGYQVAVPEEEPRLVLVQRKRRHFTARLTGRTPGQNLYSIVMLDTLLESSIRLSSDDVIALNTQVAGVTFTRCDGREIRASMTLLLLGGVTPDWIVASTRYWSAGLRAAERLLRKLPKRESAALSRIH